MSTPIEMARNIAFANVPAHRVDWPTVGNVGLISDTKLADYQANDLSGREWVSVTEWTHAYTDMVTFWFGPVIEVRGDRLLLDVGFPLWLDLGRCDVRRVPSVTA